MGSEELGGCVSSSFDDGKVIGEAAGNSFFGDVCAMLSICPKSSKD